MNSVRPLLLGAALAITAMAQTFTIANTSLPGGTVGQSYSAALTATGGNAPLTWSAVNLPPGLVMNSSSGIISGTPVTVGTYTAMVTVVDVVRASVAKQFTISITSVPQRLSITTNSTLPIGQVGQNYVFALTATGGTTPYRWAAGQGFPSFFALNATTGTITGTPTTAGPFQFQIQVTDATNASTVTTFSITINPPPLTIVTVAPLFNGILGTAYVQSFSATGGVTPYTWAITSGSAPAGLTLDPSTGNLQGTPQAVGTSTFTVQVTDKAATVVSQTYSITVSAPVLTITVAGTLPAAAAGVGYSQKLPMTASGGTPPYTWSLTGGSVPGLTFDPSAIALGGTPTTAGTYNLTVQVTDSTGLNATKGISLVVAPASITITTARQLPDVAFNTGFSQTLSASGGLPPYTWSANGLPSGLALDANSGTISGTPVAAGAFSFAVTVTDSALKQFSDRFSINVTLPGTPSVTLTGLAASIGAVQQSPLNITLDSTFPVTITGQAFLSFEPDTGPVDRTIQFASGGTVASFTIPAGSTTAISDVPLAIQTGTVSGTLTVSLRLQAGVTDITPNPAPVVTAQLGRAAPVVSDVQVNRTSTALNVVISGYSTAREITQMTFNFVAAAGQTLQAAASAVTVSVDTIFSTWYQDPVNGQYGSQFVFTQPFAITGDPNQVTVSSVVLTNRLGSTTVPVNK